MRQRVVRACVGYAWGLLLFLALAYSLKFAFNVSGGVTPAISQIVVKGLMILIALAGWMLLRRPLPEMGWQRIQRWAVSDILWYAISAVGMAVASTVMVLLEVRHPLASQMSLAQIVVIVWLGSSLSEEIYVRGLVQSWIADREASDAISGDTVPSAFEPAIVASALLFASMHVPLLWSAAGIKGGLPIVLATLLVGWACAVLRARCRSLWPAIACHILGNVAGLPGGIIGVLLFRLIHGHLPDFVKTAS
jgi:membrane protease YdiL (CAAX protease family)